MLFFDAFTRFGPRPHAHGAQPWSLDALQAEMDHCSISGALVTSTACVQYDPMLENRRLSERLRPHDHLFPAWNVMPHWTGEVPEPAPLADLMEHDRVRAVTLCPRTNGWDLFSRHSRPLMTMLQERRILTILEVQNELAATDIERVVSDWPDLPVLLVGAAWRLQRYILPLMLHHTNLNLGFDHFQGNRVVEWLAARGCAPQLLYASHAVEMAMGPHRAMIDYADLPEESRAAIAGGNLVRLLKGLRPPRERVNPAEDEFMRAARAGLPPPTPVVDFHVHILDEGLQGAGGSYAMLDGGPRPMWQLAERLGVEAMGVMSWDGTVGTHADQGNVCTRAALDAFPDSCWGLATFDVCRDPPAVLREKMGTVFADRRFLGLKPYPSYGKHYDDPVYAPLWEFGNARGLYALLHPNRDDLSELDGLCPAYPNLTFVVAHCGGSYAMAEAAVAKARRYPNVYLEITLTPVCLGIVDYLVRGAGADRVLYGSDQPMRDPRPQLGWVLFSRLTPDEKRRVLGDNARALITRIRQDALR